MPIVQTSYVKSKNLYALDLTSFEIKQCEVRVLGQPAGYSFYATVDAVWTKTVKNVTAVTKGTLYHAFPQYRDASGYSPNSSEPLSFETFMDTFDGRYGGNPVARWDGSILWTPSPTPLNDMVDFAGELDPVLSSIPAVPPGYSGWFLLA